MKKDEKRAEMTEKTALEIAEKAFKTLRFLFEIMPLRFSDKGECGVVTVMCDSERYFSSIEGKIEPGKEEQVEVTYRVCLASGEVYKIQLWDSEDAFGYVSCSPAWDPATYVFCNFEEERRDGSKRCEMHFAFDIEKKTFVELFEIEHFNRKGLIRSCEQIDYIESMLLYKEIFD